MRSSKLFTPIQTCLLKLKKTLPTSLSSPKSISMPHLLGTGETIKPLTPSKIKVLVDHAGLSLPLPHLKVKSSSKMENSIHMLSNNSLTVSIVEPAATVVGWQPLGNTNLKMETVPDMNGTTHILTHGPVAANKAVTLSMREPEVLCPLPQTVMPLLSLLLPSMSSLSVSKPTSNFTQAVSTRMKDAVKAATMPLLSSVTELLLKVKRSIGSETHGVQAGVKMDTLDLEETFHGREANVVS